MDIADHKQTHYAIRLCGYELLMLYLGLGQILHGLAYLLLPWELLYWT